MIMHMVPENVEVSSRGLRSMSQGVVQCSYIAVRMRWERMADVDVDVP